MSHLKDLTIIVSLSALNYTALVSCEYTGAMVAYSVTEATHGQESAYQRAEKVLQRAPSIPLPVRIVFFAGSEAYASQYREQYLIQNK